ncbi:MAG: hypothetical protein QW317_11175, partial [Thermoproteus sp.]
MDFQTAMRTLYRGYLYQLILAIALIFLSVAVILSVALQPGGGVGLSALLAASALLIAVSIAVIAVFFLFVFRGYYALYKLGFRWAWWLTWGVVALIAIVLVGIAVIALYYSSALAELGRPPSVLSNPYSLLSSSGPLLGYFVVLTIFGVIISIAHILLLRDLHDYTKVGGFRMAYILYIIALILSFLPLVSLVGAVLAFAEYVVEMLAYREAASKP